MTPEQRHDWKIERLEQRCAKGDSSPSVHLDLAEALFQKGYYFGQGESWYHKAREYAEGVVGEHGRNSRALNLLANACYGLGDLDAAESYYLQAIEADPGDSLAHVGLGNLHKHKGNHGRAVDAFTHATELDPDLWQAHYNLGGALYLQARDQDFKEKPEVESVMHRAIYHLVVALRLRPFESFVGNIYKDLGELFLHTRQYKYARRFFNRLVKHPEYGAVAHYYLGLTHFSMGRYIHAIHHYREFLSQEPQSALAYAKIGLAQLELGEWVRAREACTRALDLEPMNILARFSLGCIDLDQRLYTEAEDRFHSILEDDPNYFPAYVELVKTHFVRGDLGWLFGELQSEIQRFDADESFDGGRQYYKGSRGRIRRRIDVLLAQVQEVGIDAFSTLAEILETVITDSLRFQIWEQLYELSRKHRVDAVLDQLEEPDTHFGRKLGRTVLMLSQHLPEEAITDAFHVPEESVKQRAQNDKPRGEDLTAYMGAIESVREEVRDYQAHLLLALAVKGTTTAEDFLVDHLNSDDRELMASAAIALLFYGSTEAVRFLRAEAESLEEPHRERLRELVELGISRSEQAEKVIELDDIRRERPPRPPRRPGRERCTLCSRDRDEVDRLMSGNRVYLCNLCVSYIHQHRTDTLVPDQEDHICSFCNATIFEVARMHEAKNLLLCGRCLDTCVDLLAREEVDRFLRTFT